eukprot:9745154-Heterocapsa_arctica.AAC.1
MTSQRPTEVPFGRDALSVCPFEGFVGAKESLISNWRGVPQGSPGGQTLREPLLRVTSVGGAPRKRGRHGQGQGRGLQMGKHLYLQHLCL